MDTSSPTPASPSPMAGLTAHLPGWTRPPAPRQDPTTVGDSDEPAAAPAAAVGLLEHPRPAPGRTATRTTTSSKAGEVDEGPVDTAKLVAAALGIAFLAGAWVVRAWGRRRLRRPDERQLRDIAQPLARLAARHWQATVNRDLVDVIDAGGATLLWLEDGPLTTRDLIDTSGVPADLQEEQQP